MGTREEFKENPIRFIKNIAMDVVVVIVALAYVFYNMIKLEPTETNILVLIAQAIVGIICGVVIKQALGENGFSKGYNSNEWIEENNKYNNACNDAVNYTDRVDNFYLELEIEKNQLKDDLLIFLEEKYGVKELSKCFKRELNKFQLSVEDGKDFMRLIHKEISSFKI